MSALGGNGQYAYAPSYEEAPRPLTDQERRLLKRMFSDFFEVPTEWKAALKAELERDPPILGKATLGGLQSNVPLESLASGGQIGKSGVSIGTNQIRLGSVSDYVAWTRWTTGQIWTNASVILMGASQNLQLRWPGGSVFEILADRIRFGANADVFIHRNSAEEISTDQRLALSKSVTSTETPLVVNCGGAMYGVKVGPADSAGPGARVLYIDN